MAVAISVESFDKDIYGSDKFFLAIGQYSTCTVQFESLNTSISIRVSYVTHNVTEYCNLIGAQDSCAMHKPMLTLFPDPLSLQGGSGNETSDGV